MLFCSGSSTSRSADAGSPRKSEPSLSISSRMNTGFFDSARRSPWIHCPGGAPLLVRRRRRGPAQPLDHLPGERPDVGPAVTADLGFVAHAAERDAHKLASERIGD